MNKSKLIEKFNLKANSWLLDLENIDEKSLQINPNINSWSIAEVYDHIIRVARSYQIPNFKKCLSGESTRQKRKNIYGLAVFNLGLRRQTQIKMEKFPLNLVKDFTPKKRDKPELITDFKNFIQDVNELKIVLLADSKNNKHYHPMFGDITTANWFSLIEIHMGHHDHQKTKILQYLDSHASLKQIV